jgi:SAM-dependent methyltransferase
VPPPGWRTLDLGCGEGRVARDLAGRGHAVVGIDASPTLVELAREADPGSEYLLGDAAALPFDDASFDLVVAYNLLMDVEDMAGAVRETARVLVRGGRLCASIVHPIVDAGRFDGDEPDARFVFEAPYFERREYHGRFESGGLGITFHGYVRPVEDYTRALEDAGFLLDGFHEPADPGDDEQWKRIPNFLYLRAVRP